MVSRKNFPGRSDISPDGSKLIYFATKYSNKNSEFPIAWTGLCKLPWLTALCAWPNGDTYYGGGLFETDTKVWVNQNIWHQGQLTAGSALPPDFKVDYENSLWDANYHDLSRLERSGWKPMEAYPKGSIPALRIQLDGTVAAEPTDPGCLLHTPASIRTVHEKSNGGGEFSLVLTSTYNHYKPNTRTFEWRNNHRKTSTSIQGAVWADWDKRGRLVYAKQGKLFAVDIGHPNETRSQELADFNSSRPRRTKPPHWAQKW